MTHGEWQVWQAAWALTAVAFLGMTAYALALRNLNEGLRTCLRKCRNSLRAQALSSRQDIMGALTEEEGE